MRKYKCSFDGFEVDLDSPKTYKHLPKTTKELRDLMFREIGYAVVYMDYFPDRKDLFPKKKKKDKFHRLSEWYPETKYPNRKVEVNNVGYRQRQRVYKLIKNFAENERKHGYTEDKAQKAKNLMWYKEQVFLFMDEIENMC